jgi:hypothetical protein
MRNICTQVIRKTLDKGLKAIKKDLDYAEVKVEIDIKVPFQDIPIDL